MLVRSAAGLCIFVVLGAACVGPQTSETQSQPTTPPQTTAAPAETSPSVPVTTAPPVPVTVPVDVTTCEEPPDSWELFCDSYELILSHYVDETADADLADGAARGILELGSLHPDGSVDRLTCAIPTASFEVVCDTLVPGPLDQQIEAAVRGMLAFGLADPNSAYLTPEAVERAREDGSGSVEGIGALVTIEDPADPDHTCAVLTDGCQIVVVGLLTGSPAEQSGLAEGDLIVAVDGRPIAGATVDEVVGLVRGPAGSDVTLTIRRAPDTFDVTIQRAKVDIPIVESELLEPGLGYVRLSFFASTAPREVRGALEELFEAGATQLIFDLQNNPGGALDAAVGVASEFLAGGLVLRTESPDGETEYRVRSGGAATDPAVELVVLVNGASASASEVVAAALQEAGRATIIGEPSFGKNTVQREYSLDNGGALKVTVARWVTPNGVDFGGVGVEPDVVVADTDDGRLLSAARDYLART